MGINRFINLSELEQLRERLRKMIDKQLVQFGKAARFMCRDKEPRQVFVIQLEEARGEWRPSGVTQNRPYRVT